jgi:prevent-host-death family protein
MTSHKEAIMSTTLDAWPVYNAKARFSELLDACIAKGPQTIMRRGSVTAVLVPVSEWERLNAAARPSLKALLLADAARCELELPPRGQGQRRPPVAQ